MENLFQFSLSYRGAFLILLANLFALFGSNLSIRAGNNHVVTLDDLGHVKRVENMQVSPDGKLLAYVTDGALWVVSTKQGSTSRKVAAGTVPVWSPNSKLLAYYSGGPGAFQLWVLDIASDHTEQITSIEGGIDPDPRTRVVGWIYEPLLFSWSPDGTRLVFASRVTIPAIDSRKTQTRDVTSSKPTDVGMPLVLTTKSPPQWALRGIFAHGFDGSVSWATWEKKHDPLPNGTVPVLVQRINQLFVVDAHTKITDQLTKNSGGYFNPEWSPDGQKIICASTEGKQLSGFGSSPTNIYAIQIASGKVTALTTGPGDKRRPKWAPDGKWIAYLGGAYSGEQSVFLMSAGGGQSVAVTSKLNRAALEFHWSPDSKSIVVLARDGVSTPIVQVDIRTGSIEHLDKQQVASINHSTIAHTGLLAWEQSDSSSNNVIHILSPMTSSSYALVDLNQEIKEWKLGDQEVVRWKNRRGDELEGILIKPVGYHEGRKYPLIVDCYPGLTNVLRREAMLGNQAWAARGYVIFNPSARAPHVWMNPVRNEAYNKAAMGPQGWDVTVDDVMSGVDELIRRGIVEPDRMGLYGFSNGGAVVNYLVTRTNRFKCAVSVAAVYPDWLRPLLLESDSGIRMFAGGISPWDDPQGYVQLSAVFHLSDVTTPMLLADGDNDGGFLLGTIEMYNVLRYLGKDVIFLRYPDQRHGFTGAALKDFWQREQTFFDKYLKPEQPTN